jgi:hypothetical protein
MNGFCYALRFIKIYGCWTPGGYCAKSATTGTHITENHKSGSTFTPALPHVRTVTTLTNGMEFMGIYKPSNVLVTFTNRQFYTQPIGFLYFGGGRIYFWNNG